MRFKDIGVGQWFGLVGHNNSDRYMKIAEEDCGGYGCGIWIAVTKYGNLVHSQDINDDTECIGLDYEDGRI